MGHVYRQYRYLGDDAAEEDRTLELVVTSTRPTGRGTYLLSARRVETTALEAGRGAAGVLWKRADSRRGVAAADAGVAAAGAGAPAAAPSSAGGSVGASASGPAGAAASSLGAPASAAAGAATAVGVDTTALARPTSRLIE